MKYYHTFLPYSNDSTFSISFSQKENAHIDVYLYGDESKIEKDFYGDFINYLESFTLTEKQRVYIPKEHKLTTGNYYIAVRCRVSEELETHIVAYTPDMYLIIFQIPFKVKLVMTQKIFIIIFQYLKLNILR